MKDQGYINPNLQQMGTTPRFRRKLKNAFMPAQALSSQKIVQAAQPIQCAYSTSRFDLKKHPTHRQLQASLFKLPLEIRLLIYKEVIDSWTGGPVEGYHVLGASEMSIIKSCQKATGLTFSPCDSPSSGTVKGDPATGFAISSFVDYDFPYSSKFHWWTRHKASRAASFYYCRASHFGRLGIFLTCRRVYSEAIELLYSSHTFDLTGLSAAHMFLSTISPRSLDMIRFLTLNSIDVPTYYTTSRAPPHTPAKKVKELRNIHRLGEEQWVHSCRIIQTMSGLKSLRIKIDNGSFVLEPLFLKPLMEIQLKDDYFMLEVPNCFRVGKSDAKHISGRDGTIPFKIERGPPLPDKPVENVEKCGGPYHYRKRKVTLLNVLCCPVVVVVRVVPIIASLLKSAGEKKFEYYKEYYREGARST